VYAGVYHAAAAWRLAPGNKQVANALGAALAAAGASDAARDVLTSHARGHEFMEATIAAIKEIEYLAEQGYERPVREEKRATEIAEADEPDATENVEQVETEALQEESSEAASVEPADEIEETPELSEELEEKTSN